MNKCLGKLAPRHDERTLQMAKYCAMAAPAPPAHINWAGNVPAWGMMLNDTLGDCTFAAAGHMIQGWTFDATGTPIIVSDAAVLKGYEDVGGYVPGHPETDNGAVELDVLNYWRKTGVGGHKIAGYTALEPRNYQHIMQSVWLFGGAYIGVALPLSAQTQHLVWSVPSNGPHGRGTPGSWGGHAVPVLGYNSQVLMFVSWGQVMYMTWQFWKYYCDEAYAVLSQDWLKSNKLAPSGFDFTTLQQDLSLVIG